MKYYLPPICIFLVIVGFATKIFTQQNNKFVHAVWYNAYQIDVSDEKLAKQKIDEHFKIFQELKINTVVFLVKYPNGLVYYKSKYARAACEWDVLDYVIKKCREYKMEIHPYLNIFAEEGYFLQEHPEYAEVRQDGTKTNWSSPAVKAVRERMFNIIKEIIQNYDVDGIQLDRIRYQGYNDVGFHPESVKQYKKKYKKEPNPADPDFYQFKCDLVSSFVETAYKMVKSYNPKLAFSASVFHTPTTARNNRIAQQWDLWVKENWLDYVYPMAYTATPETFKKYLNENVATIVNSSSTVKLVMGIGAYYKGMDKDKLAYQIKLCLETPVVSGICYFNAYSLFDNPDLCEVVKKINLETRTLSISEK
ncbi:MAG: family 10 glycosylhydrolase [Endomicrobia bacterium]|nr:family 10 glycosylhydrolase [Endomicrobiia bacterium]